MSTIFFTPSFFNAISTDPHLLKFFGEGLKDSAANAPASLECKVASCTQLKDVDGNSVARFMVIGQVIAIHIRDDLLKDGLFDTAAASPLARCGYMDYAAVERVFQVKQS